jgi:hypothetical protein
MKMAVFWVVAPFTDVSEVLAASIIRAMSALLQVQCCNWARQIDISLPY